MHISLGFFCLVGLLSGCVYRFTNQHVILPVGVKTIAIEAIYDTSREVLPHEILWEAIQRAFAADGHLQLASQGKADALVRAHIKEFNDAPTGTAQEKDIKKDENQQTDHPKPDDFRNLSEASEFTTRQNIRMVVFVEVLDLNTKAVLFSNSYDVSKSFRSYRSETTIAQKKTHYLLFEEARNAQIKEMSNDIAQNVVRDFLVGR